MFPFNSGESIFKISSNYQIEIPEDVMIQEINYDAAADPLRIMIQSTAADHKNPLPPFKITASNKEEICGPENDEDSRKKKKHRETEKQRRMEMASLFGNLRSLLPLEFIRGKRSMTDQMNEAVNYIRHLQTGIKELERKRDKIKNTTNPTISSSQDSESQCGISSIVVLPSIDGFQIMIRHGSKELGVYCPISAVMKLLAQQQCVNVFSCSTSRVDDGTLYKIHCQVNDVVSVDLTKLRLRLEALLG